MATSEELILAVNVRADKALKELTDLEKKAEALGADDVVIQIRALKDETVTQTVDLIERLKATPPTVDIQVKGEGIEGINAGLSEVETKAKTAATATESIGTAGAGIGSKLGGASNAAGNLSQALGGAGSAAVNTGQAVEGMARELSQLAPSMAALGPIGAGLGAAVAAAGIGWSLFQKGAEKAKEEAKQVAAAVQEAVKSLREVRDAGGSAAQGLDEIGRQRVDKVLIDAGAKAKDLVKALNTMGISATDLIGSFDGTNKTLTNAIKLQDEYEQALTATMGSTHPVTAAEQVLAIKYGVTTEVMHGRIKATKLLEGALSDEQKQTLSAIDNAQSLDGYLGNATQSTADLAKEQADLAQKMADANQSILEAAAGFDKAASEAQAYDDALKQINEGSALNFSMMAEDTVKSFDAIKGALKDTQNLGKRPLVPTAVEDLKGLTKEQGAVIDSVGGMRDAIQTELAAALKSSGGDFDALRGKAAFFRDQVASQFPSVFKNLGLSTEEANLKVLDLMVNLGLMPAQVETEIKLTKDKEAIAQVQAFGSAIELLPPTKQIEIQALVAAGEGVKARQILFEQVAALPGISMQAKLALLPGATEQMVKDAQAKADKNKVSMPATVDADTKAATQKVDDVKSHAEKSDPKITPSADTKAATTSIDDAAKPRTARVTAVAETGTAERQLDSLTKPRTVIIRTVSTGGGASGSGGTGTSTRGAPLGVAPRTAVQAQAPMPSVTNISITVPPGSDADSRVVRSLQRWATRNGSGLGARVGIRHA